MTREDLLFHLEIIQPWYQASARELSLSMLCQLSFPRYRNSDNHTNGIAHMTVGWRLGYTRIQKGQAF